MFLENIISSEQSCLPLEPNDEIDDAMEEIDADDSSDDIDPIEEREETEPMLYTFELIYILTNNKQRNKQCYS